MAGYSEPVLEVIVAGSAGSPHPDGVENTSRMPDAARE